MWNRSHDQSIEIHNYNTVMPAPLQSQRDGNLIAGLAGLIIMASTVIVLGLVIWRVAIKLIDALSVVLVSLIAVLPWLAGLAGVIILAYWFLQTLPDAIQEVAEIRRYHMIAKQPVLMIEQKDTYFVTVDSNAVEVEAR